MSSHENVIVQGDGFEQIVEKLTGKEREEARRLADSIEPMDSNSLTHFGTPVQAELSRFSGQVLEHVKTRDSDLIGTDVSELMLRIKGVDVERLDRRSGVLAKMPLIGKLFDSAKRTMIQYQSVETQVNVIIDKLDQAYIQLEKDISFLDEVYNKNYDYYKQLELHIAAAKLKLDEISTQQIPDLKVKSQNSNNPILLQQLQELVAFTERLDKKLDDFRRSRFISLGYAPRIKLIQKGNQLVMEKIQSIIYNLIPLWKMDMVTGITQMRTSRNLQMAAEVRRTVEESMVKSSDLLRSVSIEIASESEAGIVSIETLRSLHNNVITALAETKNALEEGKRQRVQTANEMAGMEEQLKLKIMELMK